MTERIIETGPLQTTATVNLTFTVTADEPRRGEIYRELADALAGIGWQSQADELTATATALERAYYRSHHPEENAACGCLQEFDDHGDTYVALHSAGCEFHEENQS